MNPAILSEKIAELEGLLPYLKQLCAIQTLEDEMVRRHGEACTKSKAAGLIGAGYTKITSMLEDGRLQYAGENVSVPSIARYLSNPKEADFQARCRRAKKNRRR